MAKRNETNQAEIEADEHEQDAKELSLKLLKVVVGYEAATAVMAIGLVLQHIGRNA
jgi:hypothetical protein